MPLIISIIILALEALFAFYLFRKYKSVKEKEAAADMLIKENESRKKFLDNQQIILKEDFTRELEERKKCLLDEFMDNLKMAEYNRK